VSSNHGSTPTGQHYLLVAVDFFPKVGGIARYVHGLSEGLRQLGHQVTVLAPRGSALPVEVGATYTLLVDEASDAGVRAGARMAREDKRIADLLTAVHNRKPIDRLMVMHPFYYGLATITFARQNGIPSAAFAYGYEVRSQVGSGGEATNSLPARTRRVYAEADAVFPISDFTAKVTAALLGKQRPMTVTGCGLSDHEIERGMQQSPSYDPAVRRTRRRDLGLGDAPAVAFVGRLVPSKSVDTLVRAVAEQSRVQAWILGDGPQHDYLKQLAADYRVADRVLFFGGVDESRKWEMLSAADALVLPSRELQDGAYEGFGIVLLEASAAGCVALGSRSGGIPDAVADGQTGRLFEPGDASDLAAAITWVVDEPDAAAATVIAARSKLRTRLNWPAIAADVASKLGESESPKRLSTRSSALSRPTASRWLVVTDAFPPNNRGGAEVSLELIVRRLRERGRHVDVAVLDADARVPQLSVEEDMGSVFRLPFRDSWLPEPHRWPSRRARQLTGVHPIVTKAAMVGAYLGRRDGSPVRDRARRLWLYRHLGAIGKQGLMPISDEDLLAGPAVRALQSLLKTGRYTGVHADNYRSIMVTSASVQDQRWSALVRDNRFFCAHPGGDMRVAQNVCGHCLFECTSVVKDLDIRSSLVSLMEETIVARRARLAGASVVAGTSEFLIDEVRRVLPSGRDVHRVRSPVEDSRYIDVVQAGVGQRQPPQILVVGMVGHNKGTGLLPEFAARLATITPEFSLALCGRGHLLDATLEQAETMGVRSYFSPLGFLSRDEMYREYARSTIVLVPAIWPEPFGRVPLESGMSRRPIVAFGTGGLPEVIRHDETGLLVEPRDLPGLVTAVAQLLASPAQRRRMGEAGRRFIAEEFNVGRAADEMEALWQASVGA
jgi:glycosyltransferase involved in cell wall biosynthesis